MFLTVLKSERALKSWMGFLAKSPSSMASAVAGEELIWDTATRALSSPESFCKPGTAQQLGWFDCCKSGDLFIAVSR